MKRAWALALTATMAVATVGFAAPAQAAGDADCLEHLFGDTAIDIHTISIDRTTLQVRINPSGVDDDVNQMVALAEDVVEAALCLEGGLVTGRVDCLVAKVFEILNSLDPVSLNLRYVYLDPATGEIVVDAGRLVADATSC